MFGKIRSLYFESQTSYNTYISEKGIGGLKISGIENTTNELLGKALKYY